ncbi:MAG: type IV secretory system conjugative DNA transfer family protein, partial [Ruminococcus sp.]|nr:type IV secretory system conjugative DNA transfer family protein [Ruminococcus sp.]
NTFIDVTGSVGSGKTDWIMMQVVQRAKAGDVVVVFDPTNAFCQEELSAHRIPEEIIDNYFTFWDMSTQGWPVNILDLEGCEDITQRVQRLSSLLISGMHLTGSDQIPIVMTKAEEWLQEYEINNSLSIHDLPARFDGNAEERKLKTKLAGLLSTVKKIKNGVQPPGWNNLLTERGKVLVISAGNATIKIGANPFDILFDTLYSFKDKNRDGRITVVLDEVQTLNHGGNSTLVNILSRVRKLDISVILASQDYLNRSLAAVYNYCGTHILFRPLGEECIRAVAELTKLDINVIRTLPDFCCAIMGAIYSEYSKKNKQLETAIIGETYRPPYVDSYDKNE